MTGAPPFSWKYETEKHQIIIKTAASKANIKTNIMGCKKRTYHNEWGFAINYFSLFGNLISEKECFINCRFNIWASQMSWASFVGVFPVNIRNKFVLQEQVTITFDERRQPQKIFLPKSCSSAVVQILKNICEGVLTLRKLPATLIKKSSYINISQ